MKKYLLSLILISLLAFTLISYCATYTSSIPGLSGTYVKATTTYGSQYYTYFACDPAKSLTGVRANNSWLSNITVYQNQRFHIDLTDAETIRRIYYENGHNSGGDTNVGVNNFTFWGSNSATSFTELDYSIDTGWTQLTIAQSTFDEHVGADQADPKYILVTNSTAYQYYCFKFADTHGGTFFQNVRRIELQTEDGWPPAPAAEDNAIYFGTNF